MTRIGRLALIAGVLAASASAQRIPVQSVGAPPFTEIRSNVVKTAGGEMLGLVDRDLGAPARGAGLVVGGLLATDRTVCVSIRHASGSYSANFTVSRTMPGPTLRFILPLNEIAKLRATRGELAILARASAGMRCERTDPVLPASWGDAGPTGMGYALVNDHQALRTQVVAPGRPPVRCARLGAAASTAYQVICPVNLAGPCGPAVLSIQFIEGTSQATLRTPIRRPC